VGVPRDATSDLEKFEALDPAEWCPRGYAIVNVDSRGIYEGIYDSDGDLFFVGTQVSRLNIKWPVARCTELTEYLGGARWI
jgi:hypothetical protein